MPGAFRVNVLGAALEVVCDESVPDAVVSDLRHAWADLADERPLRVTTLTAGLGRGPRAGVQVVAPTAAELSAALTTVLTLRGVAHHRGRHLMLHAGAVALPDGRVIALVGPSGAGKTTAVASLGRHHGYVTDETVAVDLDATPAPGVVAFRRPLSLVQGHGLPKRQASPDSLGLAPLPRAPLHLAAVVVLNRVDAATGTDGARVEPVGLAQAFDHLAPQLSHATDLDTPLETIATLLEATGGLRRVTYREADELLAALPAILSTQQPLQPWRAGRTPDERLPPSSGWAASPGVRWLDLGDDLVSLRGQQVLRLGGVAPVLWRRLVDGPVGLADLVDAAVTRFGPPPGSSADDLVVTMLRELAALHLVTAPTA